MEIRSRFGVLEVDGGHVLDFVRPMLGFEGSRRYVLLEPGPDRPCSWLQSVDEPAVAFPLVDPWRYLPELEMPLPEDLVDEISTGDRAALVVMCVVAPGPQGLGLNLAAPVLMDPDTRRGGQAVLDHPACRPYHPLAGREGAHAGAHA